MDVTPTKVGSDPVTGTRPAGQSDCWCFDRELTLIRESDGP